MARTETITIYKFDELSDEAKEKAREWYRSAGAHDRWYTDVYENAETAGDLLGIDVNVRRKAIPQISFSGFCSQGDGAKFEGSYSYRKGWRSALLHEFGPGESLNTLLNIGLQLQHAQAPFFYKLVARCTDQGPYQHSGCMAVEVEHDEDRYRDIGYAEAAIRSALRQFADWIYSVLEAEHDWLNADEQVDENIRANDYEFHDDGSRA